MEHDAGYRSATSRLCQCSRHTVDCSGTVGRSYSPSKFFFVFLEYLITVQGFFLAQSENFCKTYFVCCIYPVIGATCYL